MPLPLLALGGSLLGGLAGALGPQGGKSAPNYFAPTAAGGINMDKVQQNMNTAMNDNYGTADATSELQNSPLFGGMFGKGGTYDQSNSQLQGLMGQGYQLQPQDHEAYGQASGDIARMFGQQEQSLSQSLSDRGMGNSGAAGAAFSGVQGNKMEQLGGLQRQIADDRMKNTQQRIGQMQSFMSNMTNQAQQGVQGNYDRHQQGMKQKYDMNSGYLTNMQNQANEGMSQSQQSKTANPLSSIIGGAVGGLNAGMGLSSALGGMSKPAAPAAPTMAGQSYKNYGSMS